MPVDYGLRPDKGSALSNTAVTTGSAASADIDCAGARSLTVVYRLRGTNTPADLTTPILRLYLPDGTILANGMSLTAAVAVASAIAGADVVAINTYDLRGIQKALARFTNSNAGTLNADIYYYLGY